MKRSKIEQWISRDVDGELSPARKARLEKMLARDPSLAALRSQWARLARGHAAQPVPPVPARIQQEVMRTLRLRRRAAAAIPSFWHRPVWVGAMVSALAFAVWALLPGGPVPLPARSASAVEAVETFAPGSSAMVYEDPESGVTIVWMLFEEDPDGGV